jgi:hypothetical protein
MTILKMVEGERAKLAVAAGWPRLLFKIVFKIPFKIVFKTVPLNPIGIRRHKGDASANKLPPG